MTVGDKVQHAVGTAPPVPENESFPLTVTDSRPLKYNYVDCTESNDDEEEEEEDENGGKEDIIEESDKSKESKKNEPEENSNDPPKWEDFFTTETLPDSQNSLTSRSCSVPSPSLSRVTGSQTPELFSGEEEESPNDDDNFSLTLSASLSNHSSQNQESELVDTLILRHENQRESEQGSPRSSAPLQKVNNDNVQTEEEAQSESQASSDFDIPSTPESKKPRADELLLLYRKLAAGDETPHKKMSSR